MSKPTKPDLEIINTGLKEENRVLKEQLEERSQTKPAMATAASEDASGGVANPMEAIIRLMLQQQKEQHDASNRQQEAAQEAALKAQEAAIKHLKRYFHNSLKSKSNSSKSLRRDF